MPKPTPATATLPITGLVLAGGLSTRMKQDKAEVMLAGHSLLDRCLEQLSSQVPHVLISRNQPLGDALCSPKTIKDTVTDYAGPLAGVLSGLEHINTKNSDQWLLSVAVDTPFFPQNLAVELYRCAQQHPDAEIVCPLSRDRQHPTFCLWNIDIIPKLRHYLVKQQGRRVMTFLESCRCYQVTFNDIQITSNGAAVDPFFNINHPEDLDRADTMLRGRT